MKECVQFQDMDITVLTMEPGFFAVKGKGSSADTVS